MAYYQKGHRDKNHSGLVRTAKQLGASVGETHGVGQSFPDLIAHLTETVLIEVKTPDGKFSIAQLRFLAEWRGFCAFVSTDEDIIKVLMNPRENCLTECDKRKNLQIVLKYENTSKAKYPQIEVSRFDKLFAEIR